MKKNERTTVVEIPTTPLPEQLAARAHEAVREILAEAASANTTRSYASALRYWAAWHQGRLDETIALPVPEATAVQFIVDHLARRSKDGLAWELPAALDAQLVAARLKKRPGALKLSTIVHRMAVLSKVHKLKKLANPCEQPAVRHLLARARRAAVKRGERPAKKTAIARRELEALVATCDGSLEGLRDRAVLYFGFASGGRRRSEIAAADLWTCAASMSASSCTGSNTARPAGRPRRDLDAGQAHPGRGSRRLGHVDRGQRTQGGSIFRRPWGDRIGDGLSPAAIAAIVQRRAALAGIEEDFAGHSLRSGFVTEGGRQGIALPALMAMTEHRSVASVMGYFQTGGASDNPAARLLDSD